MASTERNTGCPVGTLEYLSRRDIPRLGFLGFSRKETTPDGRYLVQVATLDQYSPEQLQAADALLEKSFPEWYKEGWNYFLEVKSCRGVLLGMTFDAVTQEPLGMASLGWHNRFNILKGIDQLGVLVSECYAVAENHRRKGVITATTKALHHLGIKMFPSLVRNGLENGQIEVKGTFLLNGQETPVKDYLAEAAAISPIVVIDNRHSYLTESLIRRAAGEGLLTNGADEPRIRRILESGFAWAGIRYCNEGVLSCTLQKTWPVVVNFPSIGKLPVKYDQREVSLSNLDAGQARRTMEEIEKAFVKSGFSVQPRSDQNSPVMVSNVFEPEIPFMDELNEKYDRLRGSLTEALENCGISVSFITEPLLFKVVLASR